MKKRTYYIKRKKLVSDALKAARQARDNIDPALLAAARAAIARAIDGQDERTQTAIRAERVPVDRRKNLTMIMKYLELKPGNDAVHKELAVFLGRR